MRVSFKRRRQIPRSLAASVTTDEFSMRVTKLLLGLESRELTSYPSDFELFLTEGNGHIIKKM